MVQPLPTVNASRDSRWFAAALLGALVCSFAVSAGVMCVLSGGDRDERRIAAVAPALGTRVASAAESSPSPSGTPTTQEAADEVAGGASSAEEPGTVTPGEAGDESTFTAGEPTAAPPGGDQPAAVVADVTVGSGAGPAPSAPESPAAAPPSTPPTPDAPPAPAETRADVRALVALIQQQYTFILRRDFRALYATLVPEVRRQCSSEGLAERHSAWPDGPYFITGLRLRIDENVAYAAYQVKAGDRTIATATEEFPDAFVKVDARWYDAPDSHFAC